MSSEFVLHVKRDCGAPQVFHTGQVCLKKTVVGWHALRCQVANSVCQCYSRLKVQWVHRCYFFSPCKPWLFEFRLHFWGVQPTHFKIWPPTPLQSWKRVMVCEDEVVSSSQSRTYTHQWPVDHHAEPNYFQKCASFKQDTTFFKCIIVFLLISVNLTCVQCHRSSILIVYSSFCFTLFFFF